MILETDKLTLKVHDDEPRYWSGYEVHFNGKYIGINLVNEMGYYYADIYNNGLVNSWVLRWVADKLDELNKPIDDAINSNIGGGSEELPF